jgi:hypothetical protein
MGKIDFRVNKRANIGCGSIQPEGWMNFDDNLESGAFLWDIRKPLTGGDFREYFEFAVCSFMLQELDHHELPGALANIREVLQEGGVLRVMVPDALRAYAAYERGSVGWFPQSDETGDIDAKFCSYVTWYGTSKSIFTPQYLETMLRKAGFDMIRQAHFGYSPLTPPDGFDYCCLDTRFRESLIFEAMR